MTFSHIMPAMGELFRIFFLTWRAIEESKNKDFSFKELLQKNTAFNFFYF